MTDATDKAAEGEATPEAAPQESEYENSFKEFANPEEAPPAEKAEDPKPEEAKPDEGNAPDPQADGAKPSEQPKADPDPAPEPEAGEGEPDKQQKAQADENDIWAKAPPELKTAHDALLQQLEAERHENRSNRTRMSTLTKRVSELESASKPPAEGGDGGDAGAGEKPEAKEPSQALKALREDYPEIATPVEEMFNAKDAEIASLKRQVDGISTEHRQNAIAEQMAELSKEHPDWNTVTRSEDFHQWLASQPAYVQEAAIRNGEQIVDAHEAADIVGRFKRDKGIASSASPPEGGGSEQEPAKGNGQKPSALRERELNSATAVPNKGPGPASGPPDDFEQAFKHYAKAG